jgi:hypothetical protein
VTYILDLQPAPPALVTTTAGIVALVLDVTTIEALYTTATVTLDIAGGPPAAVTLDATLDAIVSTSVVGGGVTLDAAPGAVTAVGQGATTVIVLDAGPCTGPPGPQGEPGAPGGGSPSYRHHQATALALWTVGHDMGFYPAVTTTDTAGSELVGDVRYVDANTVAVAFSQPVAGYANLS